MNWVYCRIKTGTASQSVKNKLQPSTSAPRIFFIRFSFLSIDHNLMYTHCVYEHIKFKSETFNFFYTNEEGHRIETVIQPILRSF